MTLRDINDRFRDLWMGFLGDLEIVANENFLDWPIYIFVLIILTGLIALGLAQAIFTGLFDLVTDFSDSHPTFAGKTVRALAWLGNAAYYFAAFFFLWFLLVTVLGMLAFLAGEDWVDRNFGLFLSLVLGIPPLAVAVIAWLAWLGRRSDKAK